MIRVTPEISLGEDELQYTFIRADGPGGQKVNKTSSAVQLRFDVVHSPSLAEVARERLIQLARRKISREGILIIHARRYRTQERNRRDALERLIALIRHAAQPVKPRRPTRPTTASRQKRLETKRRRSHTKQLRRPISDPND